MNANYTPPEKTPQRFLRLPDIVGDKKRGIRGIIPMAKATWYAGIADGRYPRPIQLSAKSVAWRECDITALVKRLSEGKWNERV
jgi:prophage regulatory protein